MAKLIDQKDGITVYAPYPAMYPAVSSTSFSGVSFPRVRGKAFYDDPVKKIKHEMGYEVEPDRYEKFPSWFESDIVSVQPMTSSSSSVIFQIEFQPPKPVEYVDIKFSLTSDGVTDKETK